MTISTIIRQKTTDLITAGEHEPFLTLAERLTMHDIGVLVVLDHAGAILGIVSERDLVRAIATHKSAAVMKWLVKRPHWHLHFTPTHASWLNQVERFFALITNEAIRRGNFLSVPELISAIKAYLLFFVKLFG